MITVQDFIKTDRPGFQVHVRVNNAPHKFSLLVDGILLPVPGTGRCRMAHAFSSIRLFAHRSFILHLKVATVRYLLAVASQSVGNPWGSPINFLIEFRAAGQDLCSGSNFKGASRCGGLGCQLPVKRLILRSAGIAEFRALTQNPRRTGNWRCATRHRHHFVPVEYC